MIRKPSRAGYALTLVLVFLVLFLSLAGLAYQQTGAVVRAEAVHAQQIQRDEGSIHALARGLALLETGFPPSNPYSCIVRITTSTGTFNYTVSFSSSGNNTWTVSSAPTTPADLSPPMPSTFGL
jgi:hypothetical protein